MEITRLNRTAHTQTVPTPRRAISTPRRGGEDSLTLSQAALRYLEEQNKKLEEVRQRREQGDDMLDSMNKALKTMKRCQEIARRIMRGDKVPPQDEQYLMENDEESYKLALALRKPKKHPKEWDSVLEDEKGEKGGETQTADHQEPAAADAPVSGETPVE